MYQVVFSPKKEFKVSKLPLKIGMLFKSNARFPDQYGKPVSLSGTLSHLERIVTQLKRDNIRPVLLTCI